MPGVLSFGGYWDLWVVTMVEMWGMERGEENGWGYLEWW
jgi:hypothetical protein